MAATQAPQQNQAQQNQALVLLAATALAAAAATATAASITVIIGARFATAGIPRPVLQAVLTIVLSQPDDGRHGYGSATSAVRRLNILRLAQFVVASGRRVTAELRQARSRNENLGDALVRAMGRERRYYLLHLEANWRRMQAAASVDSAAMLYGDLLGWYSVKDSKTTADCWHADGSNFRADQMPSIGYPGMVHMRCRCTPGPPHPAPARMLRTQYAAAA